MIVMAKVSICIPTYNNVSEVERLLQSIYCQTYTDYEVIISDDSANNAVKELMENKFNKIRYYHNEKPLGHIFNWNKALSYAKGELVKIMFSDDWFTNEDSLEILVGLLEKNPQASMAFSGSMQVSSNNQYERAATPDYIEHLKNDYRYLFISNQIGAPSDIIYRRKLNVLFDEKSNWASDVFLYFEILQTNPLFSWTDKPIISIGIHDHQYTESFSKKDKRVFEDYRNLYEKYQLSKSTECKEFFLKTYLLPYHKGFITAKKCGYEWIEYGRQYLPFLLQDTVCSYSKAAYRIIKRKLAKHE